MSKSLCLNQCLQLMSDKSQSLQMASSTGMQRIQLNQEENQWRNALKNRNTSSCKKLILKTIYILTTIIMIAVIVFPVLQQKNQLQRQLIQQDILYKNLIHQYNLKYNPLMLVNITKPKSPGYFPTIQQLQKLQAKKSLIIVTLAGRQQFLQIMFKHFSQQLDYLYQWHYWVRTTNQKDLQYMKKMAKQNSWIKMFILDPPRSNVQSLVYFYKDDYQPNKVYLKMDDDIVWMENDFLKTMWEKRTKLTSYLLVSANVINNAVISYIHQRQGVFAYSGQNVQYVCQGNGWSNPKFGAAIHQQFISSIQSNNISKWKTFKQWTALDYQRISINAIMYYSETVKSLEFMLQAPYGLTDERDQIIYTTIYTKMYQKPLIVIADAICAHGAFRTQRDYFNNNHPEIMKKYKEFANRL